MSDASTFGAGVRATDPVSSPRRFEGVLSRRAFAFLIDGAVLLFLMLAVSLVLLVLGILTLGLGWLLLPAIWPAIPLLYSVLTLGGAHSATPGMRFAGIEIRHLDNEPLGMPVALLHTLGFWLSVTFLTPFVLAFALFTPRRQLLHDLLLGTVAVRSEV